jgi:hypothetical protein
LCQSRSVLTPLLQELVKIREHAENGSVGVVVASEFSVILDIVHAAAGGVGARVYRINGRREGVRLSAGFAGVLSCVGGNRGGACTQDVAALTSFTADARCQSSARLALLLLPLGLAARPMDASAANHVFVMCARVVGRSLFPKLM